MKSKTISINDKRWITKANTNDGIEVFEGQLKEAYPNLSQAFLSILAKRFNNLQAVDAYLHSNLNAMHDPFLLKGMQKAVDRIRQAIDGKEPIWIYGDYDVDGITSVSLLVRAFKALGVTVSYYIPDRHEEGYGLNCEALKQMKSDGAQVVITVDCGITSVAEAELAKEVGLDLIITDHHEPQAQLPDAYALINPKQPDCNYPYDMLAGVGIAYKLATALLGELLHSVHKPLLELAAFGTIADIAPLDGENRTIAKFGLESLCDPQVVGFKALIACSDLAHKKITAGHVGFMLAPKINAAGRIDDPKQGVVLLTTESLDEASAIAEELKITNDKRQQLEKIILEEAVASIEKRKDFESQHVTIVSGESWNSGVIGIVASRLVERYGKPALVFSIVDGKAKGSARSIDGFDIFEALLSLNQYYEKFGGHEQAAGLTLTLDHFESWQAEMEMLCKETLPSYLLVPALSIESRLASSDVTYGFIEELEKMEPYGVANPRPVFKLEGVTIQKKLQLGKNKEFTKFIVSDGIRTFDAISFDKSGYYQLYKENDIIDLLCHIDLNEFKGTQTIQFQLKDIRGYRKELCKLNSLIHQFYRAEASKICRTAYPSYGEPLTKMSEGTLAKYRSTHSEVWTIDTLGGLLSYFNRLFDEKASKTTVFLNAIPEQYTPSWGSVALVLCPHQEVYHQAYKSVEEYFEISEEPPMGLNLAMCIPDREDLIKVYKQIRTAQTEILQSMATLEWLSALVLAEANLVQVEHGNLTLAPSPEGKIDLMEVPLYKSLQALKQRLKSR